MHAWYRRDSGWFGLALSTRSARVQVPGVEVDVHIEDIGVGPSGLRGDVDDAYRDKYGGGSTGNMVGDEAAATTLRLLRN
jgi:hypothetical protein